MSGPGTVDDLVARLRAAGCVFAEEEAALLRAAAVGAALDELVARRIDGEPLEHLLGWAEFRGRRLAVGPGVFVPRRRTGLLVDLATAALPAGGVLVELCCGCAPVAATVAATNPDAAVYACDIDAAAVACARRNLPPERVFEGDLYAALPVALRGRIDVLVSNAPYVPTESIALMPREARDHENRVALDGGTDGLDVQRRIAAGVREWLAPGGGVLVATSERQARASAALLAARGLAVTVARDDAIDATAVRGCATMTAC